jgi:hypothetical protein
MKRVSYLKYAFFCTPSEVALEIYIYIQARVLRDVIYEKSQFSSA